MSANDNSIKLFRDGDGEIKKILDKSEGISFQENPFDFYIMLARYKFAARLIKKNHLVLDAGCGAGLGTVFLSKFCNQVVGADFDSDLLEVNKSQYKTIKNLNFQTINLLELSPLDIEKYDVVVSMDVIEHFTEDCVDIVASNYAKLVKPGGFAIIGTPNIASRPFASDRRLAIHPFEFTSEKFESVMAAHFSNVFLFSMTDEIVSTQFVGMSWYLMALCIK